MKKIVLFLFCCFTVFSVRADEGMWIPSLLKKLNESDLQTKGLKISVEDIYSVNRSSLKDAIVHFGGGCTAEVISYEGLILTNHHCGYGQIQAHSSVEKDYLKNGFWAMNRGEELANPGLTATFIIRMEDVTQHVKSTGPAQQQARIAELIAEAEKGTHYKAEVKPFNYGNSFFLLVTETFRDVRLVGAPPSAIGKFGGDTDNWMWPRHTGDFSLFRIYADKNNNPADYSPDNVPFTPRYSLPVSLVDVNENDFTMVFGFPGRTEQFLSSAAVNYIVNQSNPAKIKMRETALSIIDADMRSSDKIRIQYAAKQARISNAWKKWIGETRGLKRLNAIEKKEALEKEYVRLAANTPETKEKYADLPATFARIYDELASYGLAHDYFTEFIYSGPEFIRYAQSFENLVDNFSALSKDKKEQAAIDKLKSSTASYFKNYNPATDRKLFATLFPLYLEGTPENLRPDYLSELQKKYKGNWKLLADVIFEKSWLTDPKRADQLLSKSGSALVSALKKDPAYLFMKGVYEGYRSKVNSRYLALTRQATALMTAYVEGMMTLMPDKRYWFDANSTLRLTYGKAEGSVPRDGMTYTYYTTLSGVLEKYVPGDEEFDLPARLIELEQNKDYGIYGTDGELRVCFTASNHTTGGNSGSPVIDANGYLIGINFDRTWESTMSDIMFDPEQCRNIAVDMRYILFIIDKFAGAGHLLQEMDLITAEKAAQRTEQKHAAQIVELTNQLSQRPDEVNLLLQRAENYTALKMYRDAMLDVQAALKAQPKNSRAFQLGTEVYLAQNQSEEALKLVDRWLALNASDAAAILQKGNALAALKRYDEAVQHYTRYISLRQGDAQGYYKRGLSYYYQSKSDEAWADFEKAERLGGLRILEARTIYKIEKSSQP